MRALLVAGLTVVVGCGAAPASSAAEPRAEPGTEPARRESPACQEEREAILADIARSAARACRSEVDCAVVMNPGSGVPEFALVAHAEDAAALDARSSTHIDQCGEFIHHEPIDAIPVVTAECHTTCEARVTTLHIE